MRSIQGASGLVLGLHNTVDLGHEVGDAPEGSASNRLVRAWISPQKSVTSGRLIEYSVISGMTPKKAQSCGPHKHESQSSHHEMLTTPLISLDQHQTVYAVEAPSTDITISL